VLLLLILIFAVSLVHSAITPLLPRFVDSFGLSTVQASSLFSIVTLVMLVASVPVGLLADRVGPKRLLLAAIVVLAAGGLLQGLSGDFETLFAGRAVFAVGHATIWATGLAWLMHLDLSPNVRAGLLGGVETVAGFGFSIGPFVAGTTARFDLVVPFAIGAGLALLAGLALARSRAPAMPHQHAHERFRATLGRARREPFVLAAILMLVTGGGMMVANSLLVPLQLGANGVTAAEIGAIFAAAGGVGVLCSLAVNRLGLRATRPALGAACIAWIGLMSLLPVISPSTLAIVLYVALSWPAAAVIFTIPYPLSSVGAARVGLARGAVIGILNTSWALSATVFPLAGGAVEQTLGPRAAWLGVASILLVGAVLVLRVGARSGRPPPRA
jgi:DHA1 family multidrug resistance protein-like MFS transporter